MTNDISFLSWFSTSLLEWYDRMGRTLPWRNRQGPHPSPYHVWLSEIMLQQTTVATVKNYFINFIEKWPTLDHFASASLDEILQAWQGLGYYARARNMHRCAKIIIKEYQGRFPQSSIDLLKLPGIGPYTAAAISSIAFEEKITPVDGNVIRVLSRIFSLTTPLPALTKEVQLYAQKLTPQNRTGDFAQALMDLGATLCRPKMPKCLICPWQPHCQGFQKGIVDQLPIKPLKSVRPTRYAFAYIIQNDQQEILFQKRSAEGLLGGMMEVPSTPWTSQTWDQSQAEQNSPYLCYWDPLICHVDHVFTHFHLKVSVIKGLLLEGQKTQEDNIQKQQRWVKPLDFMTLALPTLMKKILKNI